MRQSAELVSIPLGTGHRQGSDVALSADGSTFAVAAETYDRASHSSVVVYVRSGEGWLTQTILTEPPRSPHDFLTWASAIAISADGDTLAVADRNESVPVDGTDVLGAGTVHLFTRAGQTWRGAGRLVATRPRVGGVFGRDVAVSGDGSRVTVTGNDGAYIADTGSRVVRELPSAAGASRRLDPVAISPDGRTVVAGAPGGRYGEAFVLVDDPTGGWTQRWRLRDQPGATFNAFGSAVAVSDTGTVVVGSPGQYNGVSVFDRRGAALVRTARFGPAYHGHLLTRLGHSVGVSFDGSTVVAGAPYRDADPRRLGSRSIEAAGAAYRWVRSPGGWSWGGFLSVGRPNDSELQGWSTAVSGDGRVVVSGAPGRSSARLGVTGAAIVFDTVS